MLSILVGDEGFLKFSYEMCYGQSGRVDIIFFCVEMPLKCFKILIKKTARLWQERTQGHRHRENHTDTLRPPRIR